MRGSIWFVALVSIGACATPLQMTAVDLTSRGQANLLTAQRDLAGQTIIVRGKVRGSTLVPATRFEAHVVWPYLAQAHTVTESLPMVLLEPGTVQCYFHPDDLDDAARLRAGLDVALQCVVYSFQMDGPYATAVLNECHRAR